MAIANARGKTRQKAIATLFLYIIGVHLTITLLDKEGWPFSRYKGLHGRASEDVKLWRIDFTGVDAKGREWVLDPYIWDSVNQQNLQLWFQSYYPVKSKEDRQEVLGFLFNVAEHGRQRLAAGHRLGPEKWLGVLGAPCWFGMPRHREVAPTPFVALRVVQVEWTARDWFSPQPKITRKVLGEYSSQ